MFDNPGIGLSNEVVTEELIVASAALREITASAKAGLVESLPRLASTLGHARLEARLDDFCARWDTGLSHLVGDGEAMSQRLGACATNYVTNEDDAAGSYQQLTSCAPPPPAELTALVGARSPVERLTSAWPAR